MKGFRTSERGNAAITAIAILGIIAVIVFLIVLLINPADAIAIILIFVGFGLVVGGGWKAPGIWKAVVVLAGIVVIFLGAILAIVAASSGALGI